MEGLNVGFAADKDDVSEQHVSFHISLCPFDTSNVYPPLPHSLNNLCSIDLFEENL